MWTPLWFDQDNLCMVKDRDYQDHSHNSLNKTDNFLVLLFLV